MDDEEWCNNNNNNNLSGGIPIWFHKRKSTVSAHSGTFSTERHQWIYLRSRDPMPCGEDLTSTPPWPSLAVDSIRYRLLCISRLDLYVPRSLLSTTTRVSLRSLGTLIALLAPLSPIPPAMPPPGVKSKVRLVLFDVFGESISGVESG